MADLKLLEPAVATGVVQQMALPDDFTWYGKVATTPLTQSETAKWTVRRGSYNVAQPNTVDAEAHIAPRKGQHEVAAALVNSREKKVLPGSYLNFTQEFGEVNPQRETAEALLLEEMTDLKGRVDRLVEWSLWQAVQGSLVFNTEDVSASVDYGFQASHKQTAATGWDAATQIEIVNQIRAIQKLVKRDAQVNVTDAYLSQELMNLVFDSFAKNNSLNLLTEQAKQDFANGGTMRNFMGINWHVVTETYNAEDGAQTLVDYLPENRIIFGNFSVNNPLKLAQGTSGDAQIGQFVTGPFSKSWDSQDPSGRTILVGHNFLPVITYPDQIVVLDATS